MYTQAFCVELAHVDSGPGTERKLGRRRREIQRVSRRSVSARGCGRSRRSLERTLRRFQTRPTPRPHRLDAGTCQSTWPQQTPSDMRSSSPPRDRRTWIHQRRSMTGDSRRRCCRVDRSFGSWPDSSDRTGCRRRYVSARTGDSPRRSFPYRSPAHCYLTALLRWWRCRLVATRTTPTVETHKRCSLTTT